MNDKRQVQPKEDRFKFTKSFVAKLVLGLIFFVLTLIISSNLIFKEFPLFGIKFLGELLLSFTLGVFGFHTVPLIAEKAKYWIEAFIQSAVSNIVWDFWEQQSKRMQTAKRRRQKEKQLGDKKKLAEKYENSVLLDTSVLIDGRIINIAKVGFFPGLSALILNVVINELHALSDSADDLKRLKGRRGLDNIEALKKVARVKVVKEELGKRDTHEVDKRLLSFAKKLNLSVMTLDFNLNKVAKTQNIKVLNLNELMESIKPELIPGEKLKVKIIQKGKEKNQGVAYLPDGTMIVVEDGKNKVGEEASVEVSRLIQSPAGKIIFAVLVPQLS